MDTPANAVRVLVEFVGGPWSGERRSFHRGQVPFSLYVKATQGEYVLENGAYVYREPNAHRAL